MASLKITLTTWPCLKEAEVTLAKVIERCVENFMYTPENCLGLIQPLNDAAPARSDGGTIFHLNNRGSATEGPRKGQRAASDGLQVG